MTELGLFGKIPAKGDFVRHNVADDAARSFEQWVQESNDSLRGAGGEMPEQPIRGVFTPPGSTKTIVAVMVPSQDKVGRKFPIVLFCTVASAQTPGQFSVIPSAWGTFLDAAAHLGQRAATLDLDQLKAALAALPRPGMPEVTRAEDLCRQVLSHPLSEEVHSRLFDPGDEMHLYAYQTFLTACQDAAKTDPGKAATVLDCPIQVDVDMFLWLELAKRVFGFPPAHPSYFWTEDPKPRLLLSLGPAPLSLLQFFANPDLDNQRLWPLTTTREKALDAARTSLGPALAHLNGDSPLGTWMDTLAERASSGTVR